jgi:hypothetical protein
VLAPVFRAGCTFMVTSHASGMRLLIKRYTLRQVGWSGCIITQGPGYDHVISINTVDCL